MQIKSNVARQRVSPNSYDLMNVDNCIAVAHQLGFDIFENKLNIWGMRVDKGDNFNDIFLYFWRKDNQWSYIKTWGTTEPAPGMLATLFGKGGRNPNGIFILGGNRQYKGCWVRGLHKGQYPALVQKQGYVFFLGYRKQKDSAQCYYSGQLYNDVVGLNNHTTKKGLLTDNIGGWSEGCQVIKDYEMFSNVIMPLVEQFNQEAYDYTIVSEMFFKQLYS